MADGIYCENTLDLDVDGVTVDLITVRLVHGSYLEPALEPAPNAHSREDQLVLDLLLLFTAQLLSDIRAVVTGVFRVSPMPIRTGTQLPHVKLDIANSAKQS